MAKRGGVNIQISEETHLNLMRLQKRINESLGILVSVKDVVALLVSTEDLYAIGDRMHDNITRLVRREVEAALEDSRE